MTVNLVLDKIKVIEKCQHRSTKYKLYLLSFHEETGGFGGEEHLTDVIYFDSNKASNATVHGSPCTQLDKYQLQGV